MRTSNKKKLASFLYSKFKKKILVFWVMASPLEKNMARRSNFFCSDMLSQDSFEKHFCINAANITKRVLLTQVIF